MVPATHVTMVADCSPGWGASPFRLDNYTLHHELKTYLKEVKKIKKLGKIEMERTMSRVK